MQLVKRPFPYLIVDHFTFDLRAYQWIMHMLHKKRHMHIGGFENN
jgi:hypothetical protein